MEKKTQALHTPNYKCVIDRNQNVYVGLYV